MLEVRNLKRLDPDPRAQADRVASETDVDLNGRTGAAAPSLRATVAEIAVRVRGASSVRGTRAVSSVRGTRAARRGPRPAGTRIRVPIGENRRQLCRALTRACRQPRCSSSSTALRCLAHPAEYTPERQACFSADEADFPLNKYMKFQQPPFGGP